MDNVSRLTLPALFSRTLSRYGNRPALGQVGDVPFTYQQTDDRIRQLAAMLHSLGLVPGDRVAILGTNMPQWCIAYYAITFSGYVVVPVLPDFHPDEVASILRHSEPRVLFISDGLQNKVGNPEMTATMVVIRMEDFTIRGGVLEKQRPEPVPAGPSFDNVAEDDLAALIYTSGTSGQPKGVMLSHRNLCFTAMQCDCVYVVREHDRFLSILPLSHTYENTIGMILPMIKGACIFYLGKPPTPSLLLPAMEEVRPTVVLSVPMVIEKIYRNSVLPGFRKNPLFRILVQIPPGRKLLSRVAGKRLLKTFGGKLKFFGIGGSKLSRPVEQFLLEARFPYAIGYGLTEAAPLLAGCDPRRPRLQSTGPAIRNVELKIHEPDAVTGQGEIWAKGLNIMKGYYKDPGLTAEVLTADGWLKTGDLGIFDRDGYLYIMGRLKNMIVLPGGENIYPEEIESVINNFRHVLDSLVLEQKGKLVALVRFNREEIEEHYSHMKHELMDFVETTIDDLCRELQVYVNHRVNRFSRVQAVLVQTEPFEKTATQKIKRYLYS
jgi:long-chain acyl-CoA synthetase